MISRKAMLTPTTIAVAGGLALCAGAFAAEPLETQKQVSAQAPDGNAAFDASRSDVAYNSLHHEHLVVWQGVTDTAGELEIFAHRVDLNGNRRGAPVRVSDMGPNGDATYGAFEPAVAYNAEANEYLVTWRGDDDTGALVDDEFEIYTQRLTAAGAEVGPDVRVSDMGSVGDANYGAFEPAVAYNATTHDYLVTWRGDDDTGALVDDEFEIYTQRLDRFGAELGTDTRVSQMGADGDSSLGAFEPAVAHNAAINQYLVAWSGDDGTGALVDDELEIFAQRVGADGAELGSDVRISRMGPDGNAAYSATSPAVAYNSAANQYLVAWSGDDGTAPLVDDELEIFAQRVGADGATVGDRVRASQAGPDGNAAFDALAPAVAYNSAANQYLVAWSGDDGTAPLVDDELEIFVQRLSADGAEIGRDTRLSEMGPDGSAAYGAERPAMSYNAAGDQYLVSWHGDDDTAPLVDDELEIYARSVRGSTRSPAEASCATPPAILPSGGGGTPVLSRAQLRINQRIGAAAVRRANAIQRWLDAGIVGTDLCGGSLAPADLDAGVGFEIDVLRPLPSAASPRPLVIPAPTGPGGATFALTTEQMRVNQRIYAAAIRRANALMKRVTELTGGDLEDGTLNRDRLRQDLTITDLTAAALTAPASTTKIADAGGSTGRFTLTARQLKINQRIASAAVRRINELRTLLGTGLTGDNFVDRSVSAVDVAPG